MVLQMPEYGEEGLIEEREDEVAESARGPLPRSEDLEESELAEQKQAEEETRHPAREDHEDHRPGAVCVRCGAAFGRADDVRLVEDGRWVHETCPEPRETAEPQPALTSSG